MANIENAILTTVAFFDTMNLPLTPLEIYRNLISADAGNVSFLDLLDTLEASEIIKKNTVKFNGMFYLKNNANKFSASVLYNHRHSNYRMAIKKWIILRRLACFFETVPFCRAVFASGSITRNNTSKNSDIDLFVIGEHGRLWTVRAFMMLAAKLTFHHRSGKNVADMFCLNHFISDKDLEIKHKSIYTAELYSKLVPIFSRDDLNGEDILEKFREKNQWIKKYVPLSYGVAPATLKKFNSNFIFKSARYCLEFLLSGFLGDFAEKIARKIQEPRIKKDAGKPDGRVIFTDSEIELHPNSPEKRMIDGLNWRLKELGLGGEWKDSGLFK